MLQLMLNRRTVRRVAAHLPTFRRFNNGARWFSPEPVPGSVRRGDVRNHGHSNSSIVRGRSRAGRRLLSARKGDLHPSSAMAPGGVEPPHTDSKSVALSAELRGPAQRVADGTRTHDHLDHNQGLYQLSYRHRGRLRIAASRPTPEAAHAPGRIRTSDPRLRRPPLCPLSYRRPRDRVSAGCASASRRNRWSRS